jgi:branched-chain amino acid transport system ATP-binding protein
LAPELVRATYGLLAGLRAGGDAALLVVEQQATCALELADYGYVLDRGRVVLEGAARRLREQPDVREAHLGFRRPGEREDRRWRPRRRWR